MCRTLCRSTCRRQKAQNMTGHGWSKHTFLAFDLLYQFMLAISNKKHEFGQISNKKWAKCENF
jgi:hypothetical protein